MPRGSSWVVVVSLTVLLAACHHSPPPDAKPAALDPSQLPAAPRNGQYNGTLTLVSGPQTSCGTGDIITLTVQNSAFTYVLNQPQVPWQPQRRFDVTIAPDGAFHANSGAAYIDGALRRGHMQGTIIGDACGYRFEADDTGGF